MEEENKKLKERIAEEGEYQPDYSLLPKQRNLLTIEELREQIRFEPHFALEGIIVECANRIHSIADCSNNIREDLVQDLRICARKAQASSLQLSAIIKEAGGNRPDGIPQEVQKRMEGLEKENDSLRKCTEELKEQVRVLRQMFSSDDYEDRKRMKKMEVEIKALKEEKERMRAEMEEMRMERNKKEQNKGEQNKREKMKIVEHRGRTREEVFPPSPIPGPSRTARWTAKAKGPVVKYKREIEDELRIGRWDYVGGG